jgi:exopolysaccharide biosynthesis polyprenyl glycosylphosphotransferase
MSVMSHRVAQTATVARQQQPAADSGAPHLEIVRRRRRLGATGARAYAERLRQVDAASAVAAAVTSYLAWYRLDMLEASFLLCAALPLTWVLVLSVLGSYDHRRLQVTFDDVRQIGRAGLTLMVVGALAAYVFQLGLGRGFLLTLVLTVMLTTLLGRVTVRAAGQTGHASWSRRVVLAGHPSDIERALAGLGSVLGQGYEVVGLAMTQRSSKHYDVPVHDGLARVPEMVARTAADMVIVLPCRDIPAAEMRRLGWRLEMSGAQLLVAPGLMEVARHRTRLATVGAMQLLHVEHAELSGGRRALKNCLERTAAAVALLVLAPVLAVLMLAIRLDSPGSCIFRQVRVGKDNREFTMFKLRTMTTDAEIARSQLLSQNECDGVLFKMRDDPRITRAGKVLRRYSLDELPQLFNVVRGDMALIGPRPALPCEVATYEPDVRRRLVVKPGLTGLWQVSGRSDLPWEEAVRLDLRYVDNWTPALDLAILLKTGRAVFSRSGAY